MWTLLSERLLHLPHFIYVLTQLALRFLRVSQMPDELEMLLDEQRLGVSAAFPLIALFFFC
jgi:hypothetical protein